jgi:hypothetical protein
MVRRIGRESKLFALEKNLHKMGWCSGAITDLNVFTCPSQPPQEICISRGDKKAGTQFTGKERKDKIRITGIIRQLCANFLRFEFVDSPSGPH